MKKAETVVLCALTAFVFTTIGLVVLAFVNHRSALVWSQMIGPPTVVQSLTDSSGEPLSQEAISELRARLEAARKEFFDSNTITFLYSLLVLSVVNLIAYLYLRSSGSLQSIDETARAVTERASALPCLFAGVATAQTLLVLYGRALHLLDEGLCGNDNDRTATRISLLRETLTAVRERLLEATHREIGLDQVSFMSILDQAGQVSSGLGGTVIGDDPTVEVRIQLQRQADDCMELLRSGSFVKRFEERMSHLKAV